MASFLHFFKIIICIADVKVFNFKIKNLNLFILKKLMTYQNGKEVVEWQTR